MSRGSELEKRMEVFGDGGEYLRSHRIFEGELVTVPTAEGQPMEKSTPVAAAPATATAKAALAVASATLEKGCDGKGKKHDKKKEEEESGEKSADAPIDLLKATMSGAVTKANVEAALKHVDGIVKGLVEKAGLFSHNITGTDEYSMKHSVLATWAKARKEIAYATENCLRQAARDKKKLDNGGMSIYGDPKLTIKLDKSIDLGAAGELLKSLEGEKKEAGSEKATGHKPTLFHKSTVELDNGAEVEVDNAAAELFVKARPGLVPEKRQVKRGTKTFTQTKWVKDRKSVV